MKKLIICLCVISSSCKTYYINVPEHGKKYQCIGIKNILDIRYDERHQCMGISNMTGKPGENKIYIDGVPKRCKKMLKGDDKFCYNHIWQGANYKSYFDNNLYLQHQND